MSNSSPPSSLTTRLEALKLAYSKRLDSELEQLRFLAKQITSKPNDTAYLEQLHSTLHTLAGSAGTFGFNQLGRQARLFEQQVQQELAKKHTDRQPLAVLEWVKQLALIVDSDTEPKTAVSFSTPNAETLIEKPKVWLIERDIILAEYTMQQLESFGFRVKHLKDADELEHHTSESPDLLLIDHNAGQTEALKSDPVAFWQQYLNAFSCPRLFMGVEETFTARLRALRSGGQAYFIKPLDIIKLSSYIIELTNTEQTAPERVLLIEDNQGLAQDYQTALGEAGMEVMVLERPETLFEAMSEFNPEIVLISLGFPDVSGVEIATLLRQTDRWRQLPIIYLAPHSTTHLQADPLITGADGLLTKPIDITLLIKLCRARVQQLREREQAQTQDGLTQLLKHASIKEALHNQWLISQRQAQGYCVVMLDIDHFKRVNDTYGHSVGDVVIATTGTLLKQRFRRTDKLGRYGGEEFMLILLHCDLQQAEKMVNGLRQDFSAIQFSGGQQQFSCTISAGIVDSQQFPNDDAETLLNRADQALYLAKNRGRNRVCLATPDTSSND
ncbi:two-component response regulator [Vibrio metschnikovii]|uniref:diguanylate cyclase n=1 Tax=Vibrio metschnikovii TaxID=28172 RepID=UPI0001B93F31|nr:diguanylate cyclase [Vibrio metschnikovii]EEX35660.1 response regulator receiver modulated diguanylate cyclase [Vibrio metschnikovii CIP 69.14]SUP11412.1 two-component response regulator [Vibrio metschnikovii]SUP50886.1 two-component response regulator [Vibrio metschnikovii]